MNKAAEPFDVKANVSAEEWQVRVDLAAAYRLVDHHRWTDMISTHISMRVPGEPHHFLINPFGLLFGEITASSLLKVDEDGNILLPSPYPFNSAGFVIHGAIHEARPEVNCVLHLHTADGTAVSAQEDGLLPLSQVALACLPKLSYHEYEGVALNMDERKRLVADLGNKDMMILRNHGTLACGTTVAEAWVNIYALERSCSIQVRAMTGKLRHAPKDAIETVARQMEQTNQNSVAGGKPIAGSEQKEMTYAERVWPAMLRLLDGIDPGYKN